MSMKRLTGQEPAAQRGTDVSRPIVVLGLFLSSVAFVVLPVVLVVTYNRGWVHLVNVIWLLLPTVTLLTSLRDWYAGQRVGATADVLLSGGVAAVWLLVVGMDIAGLEGLNLGLLPYFVAATVLIFVILSYLAFIYTLSDDAPWSRSPGMAWLYWGFFVMSMLIIGVTYALSFYFQIIPA